MAVAPALRFLTVPATTKHTATVIFVHGLGDTGFGWKPVADMFKTDGGLAHVKWVLPHSPIRAVTANMGIEMPSWFDIYSFGLNTDEDETNMLKSAGMLRELIKYEVETSGIDPSRILLGGFSQGATMSILTGLTGEPKLAGIAVLSGWVPLRNKFHEMVIPSITSSIPIFWGTGAQDALVKIELSKRSVQILTEQIGVPRATPGVLGGLTYNIYEDIGHTTNERELGELKDFIKKVLPPA